MELICSHILLICLPWHKNLNCKDDFSFSYVFSNKSLKIITETYQWNISHIFWILIHTSETSNQTLWRKYRSENAGWTPQNEIKKKYEGKGTRTTTLGSKAVLRLKWLAWLFDLRWQMLSSKDVRKNYTWLLLLIYTWISQWDNWDQAGK